MPENETTTQTLEAPKTVVSIGKPQISNFNVADIAVANETAQGQIDDQHGAQEQQAEVAKPLELTDEQLLEVLKGRNITTQSLDELKEKLNSKHPSQEPTEEEKKTAAVDLEKQMLDVYIKNGGTVEHFVAIKNVLNANPTEFAIQMAQAELVQDGFTKDEADRIIKERYFQKDDLSTLEQDYEETDQNFAARKANLEKLAAYGAKKLENKYNVLKTQAEYSLNTLKEEIADIKLQAQKDKEHAANADAFLKTLPRKQTFELGKLDNTDIAPVQVDVDESDISAIAETLKSPAKLKQFLFNEDGSFNLGNLTPLLIAKQTASKVARQALLEGQTRQVNIYENFHPARTAYELGVGGSPNRDNGNGKVASVGKVKRV